MENSEFAIFNGGMLFWIKFNCISIELFKLIKHEARKAICDKVAKAIKYKNGKMMFDLKIGCCNHTHTNQPIYTKWVRDNENRLWETWTDNQSMIHGKQVNAENRGQ